MRVLPAIVVPIPVPVPVFLTIIAVSITVPVVVMLDPPAVPFPVTLKVFPALITRSQPKSARIWGPSPITVMPFPMVSYRIPITLDPHIFGSGCGWNNENFARRWRRADPDVDGDLSAKERQTGQKRYADQCHHNEILHVAVISFTDGLHTSRQRLHSLSRSAVSTS
jgi:hypothetical protein